MVEKGVQNHSQRQTGKEQHHAEGSAGVQKLSRDDGHDRGDAAVHQSGTKAAHDPQRDVRVVEDKKVVEVLDRCETCPHREAENRRVNQESDPVSGKKDDDHGAL